MNNFHRYLLSSSGETFSVKLSESVWIDAFISLLLLITFPVNLNALEDLHWKWMTSVKHWTKFTKYSGLTRRPSRKQVFPEWFRVAVHHFPFQHPPVKTLDPDNAHILYWIMLIHYILRSFINVWPIFTFLILNFRMFLGWLIS